MVFSISSLNQAPDSAFCLGLGGMPSLGRNFLQLVRGTWICGCSIDSHVVLTTKHTHTHTLTTKHTNTHTHIKHTHRPAQHQVVVSPMMRFWKRWLLTLSTSYLPTLTLRRPLGNTPQHTHRLVYWRSYNITDNTLHVHTLHTHITNTHYTYTIYTEHEHSAGTGNGTIQSADQCGTLLSHQHPESHQGNL